MKVRALSIAVHSSTPRAPAVVFGLFTILLAVPAGGQVAGDTQTTVHAIDFTTRQEGLVLDPTPTVGPASRVQYTRPLGSSGIDQPDAKKIALEFIVSILENDLGVSVPSEIIDFVEGAGDFSNVQIEPVFRLGIGGDYGGYFEVDSIGRADVAVDYPVEVPVEFPAVNTFKCGDHVPIATSSRVLDARMAVDPAFYDLEIGPVLENLRLEARVGLEVEFCVGLQIPEIGCAGYEFSWGHDVTGVELPLPLPSAIDPLPPLLDLCEAAFAPGADEAALLGCTLPGEAAPLLSRAQQALDTYNALHGTDYTFASFFPGMVQVFTPDLASNVPLTLPEIEGTFREVKGSALAFSSLDQGRRLRVAGSQTDLATLSLDLVSMIDFVSKFPTSLSLGGGLGSIDLGDIAPTFIVDQEMAFELSPTIDLRMDLGTPMAWEVRDAGGAVVQAGSGRLIDLHPGQTVWVEFPQALQDPTPVVDRYALDAPFSTLTQQRYSAAVQLALLQVDVPGLLGFAAYEGSVGRFELGGSPKTIEDHTFTLGGFNGNTALPFELDPEKPILDVTRLEIADVVNLGKGRRAVVYDLGLTNHGDVRLSEVLAERDLAETFATARGFEALCLHSDDLTINEHYDGDADVDLLALGNALEVAQASAIDVLVRVEPEVAETTAEGCFAPVEYLATSTATGESPIGTFVTDRYDHCTEAFRSPLLVARVDLGASVIDGLEDYTVYGWERVEIARALELSMGNLGSNGDVRVLPYTARRSSDPRIVGDVHAGGDLKITQSRLEIDYLQVGGRLEMNDPRSSLVSTGARSLGSSCVARVPRVSADLAPVEGSAAAVVTRGAGVDLPPGHYRLLELAAGAEVRLTTGEYNVGLLRIQGDGATVRFDLSGGPIVIDVHDWHMLPVRGVALLAEGGSTRDLLVRYGGTKKQIFRDGLLQGTILAPRASVELDEGTLLAGALYAERVKIGPGSRFIGHDFLEPVEVGGTCEGAL
jgi:hypothetical protein